jgi:hemolysin activation/secretion protein
MHTKYNQTIKPAFTLTSLMMVSGLVGAQVAIPDAGSLLRDLENLPQSFESTPPLGSQLAPAMADEGQTIQLNTVQFENYQGMATEPELQAIVKDAIGKQLGFNGLMHLADQVSEYLKNKGYFLAFAYLPEQDISDGHLLIRIQPGRIEGGGFWDRSLVSGSGINLTTDRIVETLNYSLRADENDIINSQQMERCLLVINDLAGVSATSSLERGAEFGTTRVNLDLKATPRYTGNAWIDNYGSYYTGDWRANVAGNINNLSGLGDQLTGMITQTQFMSFGRIGYNVPVGYSGLTANAALSLMQYELGNLPSVDADGNSVSFNAGLRYPMIRSRQTNLYTTAVYDYKLLKDELNQMPDKHRVYNNLTLGINGDNLDRFGGGGLINYGVSLTAGELDRSGNSVDWSNDQAGAKTHGGFYKLNLNGTRIQKLTSSTSLLVSAALQPLVSGNLDSSEKISISGVSGVRAYASGDASGDEGWRLTIEPRYDIPGLLVLNGGVQLSAFYDIGVITKIDKKPWDSPTNSAGVNSYQISGAGLGFSWSQPQRYSLRASYAWKINDKVEDRKDITTTTSDSEGKIRNGRFWVQAMVWF